MTRGACAGVCRWIAVVSLSAFCLWRSFTVAAAYFNADDAYSYSASWRSAARHAPEGGLALLCDGGERMAPVDRSRLIFVSWERAPDRLALVDGAGDLGRVDCVLSSNWHPASAGERLASEGFAVVSTNGYVKTWARKGAACSRARSPVPAVSKTRELSALLLELSLMVAGVWFAAGRRCTAGWSSVAAFLVAAALGCVALSHPLLAPNGLGVYGGKAKLLYECGGIPEAFLDSDGGRTLQPSYPPGLTMLAYLHFAISGGCGDRLVQLLPVFAMGLLSLVLLRGSRGFRSAVPVVLFCLSPLAIRLSSGFYAEPFVALLLVAGWGMMRDGRAGAGSLAMGLAGLFRPEAGGAAVLFAACGCAVGGYCGTRLVVVVSAVVPTLLWIAACRLLGYGGLADWNVAMTPRIGQIASAALAVLDALWKQAIPVFALMFLLRPSGWWDGRRDVLLSIVPVALLGCAIPLTCGFYDAPYAQWMMDNTIPRLVWYLLPVPLFAWSHPRRGRVILPHAEDLLATRGTKCFLTCWAFGLATPTAVVFR